jgi:hypothetical protein
MSTFILFYSNKCKHSQKAIQIINKNNIDIQKICIDDNKIKLPSFLKVVPTIIDKENPQPLEGNNVFGWLEQHSRKEVKEVQKTGSPDGIEPFFSNEMSGYSDHYSYIGNENPMEHSFQFIGDNNINTSNQNVSGNDSSDKSSEKEKALSSDYERLMEQRKSDVNIPSQLQRQ